MTLGIPGASFGTIGFSSNPGEQSAAYWTKLLTSEPFEQLTADALYLVYKESERAKGQRHRSRSLMERCFAHLSKAAVAVVDEMNSTSVNRLAYTSTSTWADVVQGLPRRCSRSVDEIYGKVTVKEKHEMLGDAGLLKDEDPDTNPEASTLLLHQEKLVEVFREILHHFRVSSLCTITPGGGSLLAAAFSMKIPAAALCKNSAQKEFLKRVLEKFVWQCTLDPKSPHFKSDHSLAGELGLEMEEDKPDLEEQPAMQDADNKELHLSRGQVWAFSRGAHQDGMSRGNVKIGQKMQPTSAS